MENPGERHAKRPLTAWVLIVLVFILGISAIISGAMLFLAPDGSLMQMSAEPLQGTPFPDYFVPGMILFLFVGIFPLVVGLGLVSKIWPRIAVLNPFKNYRWAWTGSLAVGIVLLVWIITETLMLGYISFLQPVMAGWGVVVLFLTLLPNIKRYYRYPVR